MVMNFDYRILSFCREIEEINNGNIPYPKYMSLYPTNACQFNCIFCDYKELNSCKSRELSIEEWTYILDTFKKCGGQALDLCGGGEPLMLSSITDLLKYIKKLDLKIGLVTNGLFIDKKRKEELYNLILETCSYVRVSFEAGSSEMFKKIKGKDYFTRILENVGKLIIDKSNNLEVSYKYTIPNNYSESDIRNAIFIADALKFDSIQFKAACNCPDELSDENREKLVKFITDIKTNINVSCSLSKIKREESDVHICCPLRLLIDNNGDMFICCYYRHRINDHKIGNILEPFAFEKLWGSKEHKDKMKNIDRNKCNAYDCRFLRYNKMMKELINSKYLYFI